jgi:hypothetical protein
MHVKSTCHLQSEAAAKGKSDSARLILTGSSSDSSAALDFYEELASRPRNAVPDHGVVIEQSEGVIQVLEGIEAPTRQPGASSSQEPIGSGSPVQQLACEVIN